MKIDTKKLCIDRNQTSVDRFMNFDKIYCLSEIHSHNTIDKPKDQHRHVVDSLYRINGLSSIYEISITGRTATQVQRVTCISITKTMHTGTAPNQIIGLTKITVITNEN